jgi:hypothetical protein
MSSDMGCNFTKAVRRFYSDTWGRCLGGRWGGGRISRGVICNSTFFSLSGGVPPSAGGRRPVSGPGLERPGARAAWCSSGLVLERPGAPPAWCSSGLVLRRPGAPPAWCSSCCSAGLVLRRPGARAAWCSSCCSAGLVLEPLLRRPGARAGAGLVLRRQVLRARSKGRRSGADTPRAEPGPVAFAAVAVLALLGTVRAHGLAWSSRAQDQEERPPEPSSSRGLVGLVGLVA